MSDQASTTPGQEPTAPQQGAPQNTPGPEPGQKKDEGQAPQTFSAEYVAELRKENAEHRRRAKQLEDAQKSDEQKRQERLTELETENGSLKLFKLRVEVAADKDLPLSLAGRLQGSTKAELEADADKLKEDFGINGNGDTPTPRVPNFDPGVRGKSGSDANGDFNAMLRRAAGRT